MTTSVRKNIDKMQNSLNNPSQEYPPSHQRGGWAKAATLGEKMTKM
jgi:hypothetical protein